MKLCRKCNTRNRFKSGRCRTCRLVYLEENKEKLKQQRVMNKDKTAKYMREYYKTNRQTLLLQQKQRDNS